MEAKIRIESLKNRMKQAEQAQTTASTQKKIANEQEAEITEQMKAEGVTPETLDLELQSLAQQMEADLTKAESLVPNV